jgi:hypothetical protein
MGWLDQFRVHPAANQFPMMSKRELCELGKDIKENGLKNPIVVWCDEDREEWLIDGRNRLEAMERAEIELDPSRIEYVSCGDPVSWIETLNMRRRHLTKHQYARLTVKMLKARRALAKEKAKKPAQLDEVSRGGRGKVNELKSEAVAMLTPHGISKSTVERALAEEADKKPTKRRRNDAEIKRDYLLGWFRNAACGIGDSAFSDKTLDLLKNDELIDLIEDVEKASSSLETLLGRLRLRLEPETA